MITDYDYGISAIDAHLKRKKLAAIHLVVEGEKAALVDTGTSYSIPNVLEALAQKNLDVGQVEYIFLTHVHLDHAGGAGKLAALLPNAKVVVHPRGARHMIDPTQLVAGATAVYGESEMSNTYGEIIPIETSRVIQTQDGMKINLNGREFEFLDTEGHCRHHNCIFDTKSQSFFTGDTFGIAYPEFITNDGQRFIFPTTSPIQFDEKAAHASLDRLMQYYPRAMYLTHYGEVTQVQQAAQVLHDLLDEFTALVKVTVQDESLTTPMARHRALYEALYQICLERIEAIGCVLSRAVIQETLDLDLDLNAQGLLYWLEHRKK